ncbi:MAG: ParB/RepB/Spo0J family partition protein [Tissierellaceae bacterium]
MTKPTIVNINDFFGISDEEEKENKVGPIEIEIFKLVPFSNHPFKLYEGERLDDMVASIKEHGIITPLTIRPLEDGKYEILSGHNRLNAGILAGLKKIPVVIKEGLTDEEAMLIVTETNLIQRSFSELSHSEKARILTERHNAIKSQGKRVDIINEIEMLSNTDGYQENATSGRICPQDETRDKVAGSYDLSPRNVSNYIRIDMLTDELKIRLDNDEIPFTAGVDFSYLSEDNQNILNSLLDEYNYKVDLKKSAEIKRLNKARNLNYNKMNDILSGKYFEKPQRPKKPKFTPRFTKNIVERYVTEDRSLSELEKLVERLLADYFNQNQDDLEVRAIDS